MSRWSTVRSSTRQRARCGAVSSSRRISPYPSCSSEFLYYVCHPLLALEKVASVTGDQLIVGTHVDLLDVSSPAMALCPGTEFGW